MEEQPKRLCPFSLPFVVPTRNEVLQPGGVATAKLKIGLPCININCMWWSAAIKDCVVFEILMNLDELVKQKQVAEGGK